MEIINARSISEILIEADATEELKVLSECWQEIVKNKYTYTIAEIGFAQEHIMGLVKNMAKGDAEIMTPLFNTLFNVC